jgi:hypothetical protein
MSAAADPQDIENLLTAVRAILKTRAHDADEKWVKSRRF